jgi:hypothetical protein
MSSRIFLFSVILLVLGHPERSSSSTDTRPALKRECRLKIGVQLKECSKASRSDSGFTELHANLDADAMFDFANHCRLNKTGSQKITCVKTVRVHSTVARGRLMQ